MTAHKTHSLERTGPKGEQFIGRCILCGQEGLRMGDALKPCKNPGIVSSEDALLAAVNVERQEKPS